MTLLQCATLVVRDLDAATRCYAEFFDYAVVEQGLVADELALAWQAPATAGRRYALLEPASGAQVLLRFVEGAPVEQYEPIRSFGWAATELCVTDVEAVHRRMKTSPFAVIGPPRPLDGFAMIKPMQVRGPDDEVVYLTQILPDGVAGGLPQAVTLIDRPFIMVLACADMRASLRWVRDVLALDVTDPVAIRYSMINRSFDLPVETKHELATVRWHGEDFLELDQYPPSATARPAHPGALPPGVAITTIAHPDLARLDGHWASPPVVRQGSLYRGRRSGMLTTPEGALIEVVAMDGDGQ